MLTIISTIIVLSILIFVHEFGHFSAAKKIGIKVEEFGFGLPPKIWGKKIGETVYSLNLLPIGGFVRLLGEDQEEVKEQKQSGRTRQELKKYFWARSKKERAVVLLAGVAMNFLLAIAILSIIFTHGLNIADKVKISEVNENSPAQAAGMIFGDVLVAVAGREVDNVNQVSELVYANRGKDIEIKLLRENNQQVIVKITPRVNPPAGEGALGIKMQQLFRQLKYPWYQAPFFGLYWGLVFSWEMLVGISSLLWRLITFQYFDPNQVRGVLGIAEAVGEAVKIGWLPVMQLTGILSLNLAIINLLPIPALDGGRLMFLILEKFLGKKVKPKAEQIAHRVGLAFLVALFILITINDVLRWIKG